MAKYKCPTLGDCDKANSGEIFERAAGESLKCPGCGTLLELMAGSAGKPKGKTNSPLIAAALGAVLVAGAGGYYFVSRPAAVAQATTAQPPVAPTVAQASAPAAVANPGIAPSDTESKALRQESQDKLTAGDAPGAEQASAKAAVNEMLKLAIAKMAQGRLDDAEKDLNEARARDPKQPLVYYNMAVLRLRQGRTDDALKEFEACFMTGFSYFEQMDGDHDLDVLRKDKRFIDLVAKYRAPKA
jgi:hypothetical protein